MANENQQNDANQPAGAQPIDLVTSAGLGQRGAARRRFARAGAGATGVLLTLASHPGMACSVKVGPSGWQSVLTATNKGIKLSHIPDGYSVGIPPNKWSPGSGWPCSTTKTFGQVFSCTNANATCRDGTLKAHCGGTVKVTGDKQKICQLLSAAYLNVLSGRSPFLTQASLQAIWSEYQSKGTYTPMAGVKAWNAVTIVAYLTGTMDEMP